MQRQQHIGNPGTATVRRRVSYQVFNGITITNVICTGVCTFLNSASTGLSGGSSTITNLTLMKVEHTILSPVVPELEHYQSNVQTGSGTDYYLKTVGDAGNFT